MTVTARPISVPAGQPDQGYADGPGLALVPPPRLGAPRAPFIGLLLGLLSLGLVALLLLETSLAQGSFTLRDLQKTNVALTEQQQALAGRLATEQQPGALASRAKALGMVPAGPPAFLHLPDGAVIGTPHVATRPHPRPSPAASGSPSPSTKSGAKATKPGAKATKHTTTTTTKAKPKTKQATHPTRTKASKP